MRFGLTQEQSKFIHENVVEPIAKLGGRVFVYGSRARGDHQRFSDLDLMVEFNRPLYPSLAHIQELLQNSNFPYKVDLVPYPEFAEAYKKSYQKDKVPW